MQIKRNFELVFDPQEYIDFHGERFARLLERPSVREDFEQVLNEDVKVFEPVACYDAYQIDNCLHDRFELQGGTRIGGGPVMEVLRGAEELVVAVCTIGSAVDEKVRDYLVDVVRATRTPTECGIPGLEGMIETGASPRASINLLKAAKAHAFLQGRG